MMISNTKYNLVEPVVELTKSNMHVCKWEWQQSISVIEKFVNFEHTYKLQSIFISLNVILVHELFINWIKHILQLIYSVLFVLF